MNVVHVHARCLLTQQCLAGAACLSVMAAATASRSEMGTKVVLMPHLAGRNSFSRAAGDRNRANSAISPPPLVNSATLSVVSATKQA